KHIGGDNGEPDTGRLPVRSELPRAGSPAELSDRGDDKREIDGESNEPRLDDEPKYDVVRALIRHSRPDGHRNVGRVCAVAQKEMKKVAASDQRELFMPDASASL